MIGITVWENGLTFFWTSFICRPSWKIADYQTLRHLANFHHEHAYSRYLYASNHLPTIYCTPSHHSNCQGGIQLELLKYLLFGNWSLCNCVESLGDCSFLNTCFHMDSCKYVHYEINYSQNQPKVKLDNTATTKQTIEESVTTLFPAQVFYCYAVFWMFNICYV